VDGGLLGLSSGGETLSVMRGVEGEHGALTESGRMGIGAGHGGNGLGRVREVNLCWNLIGK
jgi:hypothetical protein